MWDFFYNPPEMVATATGIVSVILSWKKSIYTYLFGLISVSIYVCLCYRAGIYADMAINIFYFVMSIYGWINWRKLMKLSHAFMPQTLTRKNHFFYMLLTLFFWAGIYVILIRFTDSNIPLADAFTTAFFSTGMILMAFKYTENWIYLVIGNVVSVPLYIYKELYVSSFFFVILAIFGTLGYFSWKKEIKTKTL